MRHFLDFEKPVAELEGKIEELRRMSDPAGLNIAEEVARLTTVADRQLRATYAKLTPWQKTQVARHPDRPKAQDYIAGLITEFTPLAGDRCHRVASGCRNRRTFATVERRRGYWLGCRCSDIKGDRCRSRNFPCANIGS